MTIFDFLTLMGGLALFLFGMKIMGDGLEKRAGNKLKTVFEKLTNNPLKGLLLGLGVTAVIQSSSATTVMLVGFVNSGVMQLSQAIGVIFGANIGTTVTAWILSLTGIQGDNIFVQLLKPSSFTPILAVFGVIYYMFQKNERKQDIGFILLGFTTLMFGMETMSSAVKGLSNVPEFTRVLTAFQNPILGVLVGAIFTAIIQSSSASVGILQALSTTGSVTFGAAIPIIMGQNIGTCITAILSSIGANKSAKRVAFVHLYFNIFGTIIFMTLFYLLESIFKFAFVNSTVNEVSIAIVHTCFNLLTTIVMFPSIKFLEKLAYKTVRGSDEAVEFQVLDERFFATPSIAVEQSTKSTNQMAELSKEAIFAALKNLDQYDPTLRRFITETEAKVDMYEDKLGTYLSKLAGRGLSEENSREITRLLHCIGDFERISDHAVNLSTLAEEIKEKRLEFSPEAQKGLKVMSNAVHEIVELAFKAFMHNDISLAERIEPLEQVVDLLKAEMKNEHTLRLQTGECTTEVGFIFNDLITNYARVADHCSNIAICIIQVISDTFNTHEHLNTIKKSENKKFVMLYNEYLKKYSIKNTSV